MFGRLKNPGRLTNKRSSKFFGVCSFGDATLRYILVSIKTPFLLYYPTLYVTNLKKGYKRAHPEQAIRLEHTLSHLPCHHDRHSQRENKKEQAAVVRMTFCSCLLQI